ncbi:Spore germination protein gerPA/gerPF [Paenibacillus sp. GP183]|nr:Spore germination protein gerPA/gerPF [Paenibacillus sp. GP183]
MSSKSGAQKVVLNIGTINNGNSDIIAPTQNLKSINGAGAFVTGDHTVVFTLFSATITKSGDIVHRSIRRNLSV